jgi:hypothetical protein
MDICLAAEIIREFRYKKVFPFRCLRRWHVMIQSFRYKHRLYARLEKTEESDHKRRMFIQSVLNAIPEYMTERETRIYYMAKKVLYG